MALAKGAKIVGAGFAVGMIASFGLTRLMTKLLFSVSAADPLTFGARGDACYIPARRTLRVDPAIALPYE